MVISVAQNTLHLFLSQKAIYMHCTTGLKVGNTKLRFRDNVIQVERLYVTSIAQVCMFCVPF